MSGLATSENRVKKGRDLYLSYGHEGRTKKEKFAVIFNKFFDNLNPPPKLDLDVWMDEYFYLPAESASEHGRWRTQRFPFLRKPAKKLSPTSPCKEIGASKGAQIGFTTLFSGWTLYIADQGLGPTLYVQPTGDAIVEYSEQKLQPAIELCTKIADKLGDKRPKHLANTKKRKYFPGGYIALGSANSAPSLRSKSIRNLMLDEEDGCNQDVGGEGSSIKLAIRRTANFPDHKIARISTPVLTETSSIEPFCESGTAERYLVPCPDCNPGLNKYGTYFEIKWEYIVYENDDERTAKLACPCCGSLIGEGQKTWMLDNAFWYRYNPTAKDGLENDERRTAILVELEKTGYHELNSEAIDYLENTSIDDFYEPVCTFFLSSLYSPLGFYSWQEAVKDWIEANKRNDKTLLKTFFNTVLGKSFSNLQDQIKYKGLAGRREVYSPYGDFDLPMETLVVTMGVDVQGDRLEAQIIAWGERGEEWVVDYKTFYGDTSILGDFEYMFQGNKTSWGQLHEFLFTTYKHASGHILPIECTLIDSRYRSQYAYSFCKAHETKRVYAVQGQDGWGKGEIDRPVKPNKYGVYVFKAMQDEIKSSFYTKLRNEQPGGNYVHFSRTVEYPKHYFKGLVIEQLKIKQQKGDDVYYWENPPGGRNEALDTHNYAYVAFLVLKISLPARRQVLDRAPNAPEVRNEKKYNEVQQPDITKKRKKLIRKRVPNQPNQPIKR